MKIKTSLRTARALARPRAPSPLGALARGLLAGVAGAGLQLLFFSATRNWAPEPTPVRPEGRSPSHEETERGLEALGRRWVEDLMRRGPLGEVEKRRVATAV